MKALVGVAAASAVVGLAGAAQAGDWIVTVGGRASLAPPYEGASQLTPFGYPTINIRKADQPERFSPPDGGGRLTLLRSGAFAFGGVARIRGKRDDHGDRQGLRPINWALEPGAFVEVWPTSWLRMEAQGRRGVRGHHGWGGDILVDAVYDKGPWTASIGPRVGFGDSHYMERYFGGTPTEAGLNPVIDTTYAPKGGLRYVGAEASLIYKIDARWRSRLYGGYNRLTSIPADSPIVQKIGSRDQFSAGVGVSYAFDLHL